MKYLFYLGHPAHFHLFKNVIRHLRENHHEITIVIKKKDILEQLLIDIEWEYINILPQGRKNDKLSIASSTVKRDIVLWQIVKRWKPDLMSGTSIEIAHIGWLRRIPSVIVNEDDWNIVPLFAWLGYPFCSKILAPQCCSTGRWHQKTVFYAGYHELAYLHPDYFIPDIEIARPLFKNSSHYFIIRFSELTAYHDAGITGLHQGMVKEIIKILESFGNVYITSEKELDPELEPYRMQLHPLDIHHALAFADIFIGDSQTMTAEAAVLGTPALRFNDFVGRIGYLEELEHRYQLTFGYQTCQSDALLNKLKELLAIQNLKEVWKQRQKQMLDEKIDLNQLMFNLYNE